MAFPVRNSKSGSAASGTEGTMAHGRASVAAHGAANRLAMARALGGTNRTLAAGNVPNSPAAQAAPSHPQPALPQNDWRHAVGARVGGATVPEVHAGVDAVTQAGGFTPHQGAAIKAHVGPLHGAAGHQSVGKIAGAVVHRRSMPPMPGAGMAPPVAPVAPSGPPGVPAGSPPGGPSGGISGGGMPGGMRPQ